MMSENIGLKLRQARLDLDLSLEKVSQDIHIRQLYLQALENEDFDAIPSPVQMRGFLHTYADYLGLDATEISNSMRGIESTAEPITVSQANISDNSPEDSIEYNSILQAIGKSLHDRRDLLSLTPDEVEQHTHISSQYLKHIESGDFSQFPSPVQARGMLVNYAKFLDMDANEVLLRYAEAIQAQFSSRQEETEKKKRVSVKQFRMPLWLRSLVSPDLIFVAVLSVTIVLFVVWGIGRISATQSAQVDQPTAPSIANVLLPTASQLPNQTPTDEQQNNDVSTNFTEQAGNDQPNEAIAFPGIDQGNVRILLIVHQRTWLRVTVDDQVEFEGRVSPGETLSFSAERQVELLTGNAAAVQVFYNDQDMGILGILGEVINIIYTEFGLVAPTATLVPTPTPTSPAPASPTIPAPDEG